MAVVLLPIEEADGLSGYAKKYGEAVWGRLVAENASDVSDAEIDRILSPCVGGNMVVAVARELRDAGFLKAQSEC